MLQNRFRVSAYHIVQTLYSVCDTRVRLVQIPLARTDGYGTRISRISSGYRQVRITI